MTCVGCAELKSSDHGSTDGGAAAVVEVRLAKKAQSERLTTSNKIERASHLRVAPRATSKLRDGAAGSCAMARGTGVAADEESRCCREPGNAAGVSMRIFS